MRRTSLLISLIGALTFTSPAAADVIFYFTPGVLQPPENILFNGPGLTTTGTTIEGVTNQSSTLISVEGSETLVTPAQGQARVEAVIGGFEWATFDPSSPELFFTEFEANVLLLTNTTVFLKVVDNLGVEWSASYPGSKNGQNYFSVGTISNQLIDWLEIRVTGEGIDDIRQIRIGGLQSGPEDEEPPVPAPEPASLALFGLGLTLVARRLRRRG